MTPALMGRVGLGLISQVTDINQYGEVEQMPFICPTEQMWLDQGFAESWAKGDAQGLAEGFIRGLIKAIGIIVKTRFGTAGLDLLPRVQAVKDPAVLESIICEVLTAPTFDAIHIVLPESASR